jgi:orotidine-5'-phosphate decarboxylase
MARRLRGAVGMVKVGSQLFSAEGPRIVSELHSLGFGIFLDLKFHDIPNTVAGAVQSVRAFPGVKLATLHTLGGLEMMKAAKETAGRGNRAVKLLGVTILTSHDGATLRQAGIAGPPAKAAVRLAKLAKQAGLDGVVASAHEIQAIRRACGPRFLIVVPGIRSQDDAANDQSRIATPAKAIHAGANYLVIGRPITRAADPKQAALKISREIDAGQHR